jgi:DNA-binding GntR family transcriptional regulator
MTSIEESSLVNYPNLSDKVYEIIKNEILSGLTSPGAQLEVVGLAKRLGVSRTPVKEAISRLIVEGFVRDLPRKGYFVSKRDREDISELLDARLMLELVAVERGVHLVKPDQIEEMRQLLRHIDGIMDDQGWYVDYEEFVRKDAEFHLLIIGAARNRHLLEAYRRIFLHYHAARMHLSLGPGYRRGFETRHEHKLIVDAFESKDLPALKEAIARHMQETMKWFESAQESIEGAVSNSSSGV